MFDPKQLEEISNKLGGLIAASPVKDIEKNAKAALSGLLGKLDLVTREEFDVQAALLARTREKLDALEARVAALEKAAADKAVASASE
jgi:BMFP domain-containing protein YqiC